jgi:hypothetical protein
VSFEEGKVSWFRIGIATLLKERFGEITLNKMGHYLQVKRDI